MFLFHVNCSDIVMSLPFGQCSRALEVRPSRHTSTQVTYKCFLRRWLPLRLPLTSDCPLLTHRLPPLGHPHEAQVYIRRIVLWIKYQISMYPAYMVYKSSHTQTLKENFQASVLWRKTITHHSFFPTPQGLGSNSFPPQTERIQKYKTCQVVKNKTKQNTSI